jgi:hypothetical protein
MLPGDANPEVADLLVDERATHYWDGERRLGRAVAREVGLGRGATAWDIFLVYGPAAKWGDTATAVGSPVISESGALARALRAYVGKRPRRQIHGVPWSVAPLAQLR